MPGEWWEGRRTDSAYQLLAAFRLSVGRSGGLVSLGSVEASDVELSDPAAVRFLVRAGVARAGGSAVHLLRFREARLALPLIAGGEATGLAELSGLTVKVPPAAQTLLVAGMWGCTRFSACCDGRGNACVHPLLHVPVALGLAPGSHTKTDGTGIASSSHSHAASGDLARVQTAPLAWPEMKSSRAITLTLPHLRAFATVAVLGVDGLGPLAVRVLRASTASRLVAIDASMALRLAADHDGRDGGAASPARAIHGLMQATKGLAVRSKFDLAGKLANAIVANYGALVAAGRGTGSFLIDGTGVGLP